MSFPNGFLLSATNPIANRDQRQAEDIALRVFRLPAYQAARQKAGFLWRQGYGEHASPEALETFESAIDEYAFNYLLKAVASDADHPRFVRDFMPAHTWFGCNVPGARMGGDNPDNCYRVAGVAHGKRYEVYGKVIGPPATSVTFTLVGNYGTSVTIQTLDFIDLQCAADGSFSIAIDDQPAAGRVNHLRTAPGCKFLFVRDSMNDWSSETPLALSIRNLDAPAAEPLTDQQIAERAAHRMIEDVPLYYWFTRLFSAKPVNTLAISAPSGALGGLVTQAGAQGRLQLADDEAAIVTVDPAGAAYSGIVAHDWWFRTLEYWNHTSSLTSHASLPDADGRYTYVVSLRDPGVHNWVDTCGRHESLLLYRWQGLPREPVRLGPIVERVRIVKLRDLVKALPKNTATVDRNQRERQIAKREAAFKRRVIDG
jgi:hypothetical protein